ncbi:MAG: DNA mismatch repair endonuclease MutL [Gemmatimonadota bacterium]
MSRRLRVQVLPDAVANQIAAGEVVERPASVVKELVENALDAGATRIRVEVERGGKGLVRVADDGWGMGREDALLCLDRHATSKLREAGDLQGINTLGFRGEALPSIAAVSRLRLETRDDDSPLGTELRVNGGRLVAVEDVPRQRGTTVEVQQLFFNAPARSKFLRSVQAESRGVSDVVTSLSLAHPQVGFELLSGGRELLALRAGQTLVERVAHLWGQEAADALIPLELAEDGLEVSGLVQRPDAARPGFRRVHLFVEGRPFRDPALVSAADDGYRTTIPQGARPWMLLYLTVPRGSVDVNVHPAKAEVRFRDGKKVRALVETAVRQALGGEESAAILGGTGRGDGSPSPSEGNAGQASTGRMVRERPPPGGVDLPKDGVVSLPAGRSAGTQPGHESGHGAAREAGQMALFVSAPSATVTSHGEDAGSTPSQGEEAGALEAPSAPRLWQVHGTYLLAETRDGLLLIDQHAAHERILFEGIMEDFDTGGAESQRLLFPITIRLTPAEYREVEALKGVFQTAGFEVEGFGGDTVILHAVPAPHPHFDAERCFRQMVEELTEGSALTRTARNQFERVAMSFACKAAVKAGQALDSREMEELFHALFATQLPFHDVHGRPTTVRLTMGELERKFGRHGG